MATASIMWVDSIQGPGANLRNTVGGADTIQNALVGGFAAPNDGGGGVFYWDPSVSTGDDGGTVIVPTGSTSGRWVRVYSGVLNVRWFGAGLGGNNDQPAIQAAVQSGLRKNNLHGGCTVYLPAGNYVIAAPIVIDDALTQWVSVRLVGDGKFSTRVYKTGTDATCVVFGGLQSFPTGAASKVRHCEVSNIDFAGTQPQTSGAVISFPHAGLLGVTLSQLFIINSYRGIECTAPFSVNNVYIKEVTMDGIINCGLYAQNALNWFVADTIIAIRDRAPGTCGVWLNSYAEGWAWNNVGTAQGDTGWRFTHTVPGAGRPPTEHRFNFCCADQGGRACFWATALHRSVFESCWASSQDNNLTGAFVIDSPDVYGLVWNNGQMVNISTHGFWISRSSQFTISNSHFSNWNLLQDGHDHFAIIVSSGGGHASSSFTISCNTFMFDRDFGFTAPVKGILINNYVFNKYLVTQNIGVGLDGKGGIGANSGPSGPTLLVEDNGTAEHGKEIWGNKNW
jgi:hypothetical protein